MVVVLSIPSVQTKLASIVTKRINETYHTDIVIKKVDLSFLGKVQLKDIEIRDHHQDTLIFVDNLQTSLSNANSVLNNRVNLGSISLAGVHFHMKTYQGEEEDNLSVFIDKFDGEEEAKSTEPFILKSEQIKIDGLYFTLHDFNKDEPLLYAAKNMGGTIDNFSVNGSVVSLNPNGIRFTDDRGINFVNFSTQFTYTKTGMKFLNSVVETDNKSKLLADVFLTYKIEDLKNFTDKVKIKADFKNSICSVYDLKKNYAELSGNDVLYFSSKFRGTLNNFSLLNFNLHSKNRTKIKGDLGFVNSFNLDRGFLFDADLDKITSNYYQLKQVLPNLLGKTIPTEFKKLGDFTLSGLMKVTPQQIEATLQMQSALGKINSDLQLSDIDAIDNASYNGEVSFTNFDFGKFLEDSKFGKASLKADVMGRGFSSEKINTTIIGKVSELDFNGYTYKNLKVNGQFENKKFDGFLEAEDANCQLTFQGLADFSSAVNVFDFEAKVAKIDLKKTNLFLRDSIAEIKGDFKFKISGNQLDNLVGKAEFENVVYTNPKKVYYFKKFDVESTLKDSIRNIAVNSLDIVNGELKGKFTFKELIPITKNALGSVYTNYTPIPTKPNQYLDFNFEVYNQIVDVFLPKISIGNNAKLKGKLNSSNNTVKLNFSSSKLEAYGTVVDTLKLRLDNKNKLYNTHLTAQKITNKHYTLHKLNLLNKTLNDTLFFKSTCKGGKKLTEDYSLDFYYTIDENQKSVLGFQQSKINFKDVDWTINPKGNNDNKVVFSLKENFFDISPFQISSGEQKINLHGVIDKNDKDLKADFKFVSLRDFIPDIENLKLDGVLNGKVSLVEKDGKKSPQLDIKVSDLIVNELSQGTLKAKIIGKNSFHKYAVDVSVRDYKYDNVNITGELDFSEKKPKMDLKAKFKNYELNGFSPLGDGVISNLRGMVSGVFTAKGELQNPYFKGYLTLKNSGLTFPYLNIDYDLIDNTTLVLEGSSLLFRNTVIQDTKYDTKGYVWGSISHQDFDKWFLDLELNTPNLLALDTKEVEDIPYYGKVFIRGGASFIGSTNNLDIRVNGRTEKETIFVIPLSDVTTVSNYRLIKFKSAKNQSNKNGAIEKIEGLNLAINLEVTKDAVAQVVIDKVSGSDLKGRCEGNLQIDINTRGKFLMNGDMEVEEGTYNFRYGGIINKPFKVQKGGKISWSGDPYSAELDLIAIYHTKANPAELLNNVSATRKIPVDLYTKITGGLFNSRQDFDIVIPNANSAISSELDFLINENDINTKMRHFVFLLTTGTFYNETRLGESVSAGLTGTAVDLASSLISSIINTSDSKFKLGLGYTQSDRSKGNLTGTVIDDQVDVSVSTQITDRVLVNGKVGVPVGEDVQTSVVGEVKAEVLLNEEGSLRATFFNRPNDINYSIEEEGYTQGLGLSYKVNFDSFQDLIRKMKAKKTKKRKEKIDTMPVNTKSLINFTPKKDTIKIKK